MIKSPTILAMNITLQPLDIWVFVSYLLALLSIGAFVSYRHRKSEDLFLGDRSMGWSNVGLSIFGTNIGPTFLIATCGAGYTTGMVTANFEWMAWVFLFLLGMVFVPFYLNTKISTMPEFMNKRFGRGCYTFMSFYALLGTVVLWIGGTLFAGGALLSQLLGWELMTSVWVLAVIAASFTIAGGLVAVMVTDSFQSILMIIGAATLSIIAACHLESFSAIAQVQCVDTPGDLTWKLLHPSDSSHPWYAFVLGYPVLSLWFWCSDQTIVQRALGAKNLRHSQGGTLFAAFLKIIPPFIFLLPGIFAAQLLPGIEDDKQVFLSMVGTYLPAGLVGLIVSVLVAAVISTLDSGLNSFSTIFTLDIYKRWYAPTATEHQIKQIGRITTVASALLAVAIAWSLSKAERTNLFNLFQGIIGYMAPPVSAVFVLGIFWKRSTSRAALLTLIIGSAVSLSIGVCDITNVFATEYTRIKGAQLVIVEGNQQTPLEFTEVVIVDSEKICTVEIQTTEDGDQEEVYKEQLSAADGKTFALSTEVIAAQEARKAKAAGREPEEISPSEIPDPAITIFIDGDEVVYKKELLDVWPHFLVLSFILFVWLVVLMTIVSLFTKHGDSETPLPTLRQAYRENPGLGRVGFVVWGFLAAIMIGLYVFFQFGMKGI